MQLTSLSPKEAYRIAVKNKMFSGLKKRKWSLGRQSFEKNSVRLYK